MLKFEQSYNYNATLLHYLHLNNEINSLNHSKMICVSCYHISKSINIFLAKTLAYLIFN